VKGGKRWLWSQKMWLRVEEGQKKTGGRAADAAIVLRASALMMAMVGVRAMVLLGSGVLMVGTEVMGVMAGQRPVLSGSAVTVLPPVSGLQV
jgi:hypothetical protein